MQSDDSGTTDQENRNWPSHSSVRLFRDAAVASRGQREPIDGLLRVTAPHEWVILLGLLVAMLALAAWGTFGNAERGISGECLLVLSGNRHTVLVETAGNVAEVFVNPGDEIEKGKPLVRLRSIELERDIRLLQARLALLEERGEAADPDELALVRMNLDELTILQMAGELVLSNLAGEVASVRLQIGQSVQVGAEVAVIRDNTDSDAEAVTFVPNADVRQLKKGMDARIRAHYVSDGDQDSFEAEVVEISNGPVAPETWLVTLGIPQGTVGHLVRMAIPEPINAELVDGTPCSSRIVYERGSPISILIP